MKLLVRNVSLSFRLTHPFNFTLGEGALLQVAPPDGLFEGVFDEGQFPVNRGPGNQLGRFDASFFGFEYRIR